MGGAERMSGYGYGYGYGYGAYGYGSYGYGGGYYSISPGGYYAQPIYLSGPGASAYYAYYSGSTKFIDSAYENYYGGKYTYAATLSSSGDFTESTYNYKSAYRTDSEISSYISHTQPNVDSYYGYGYHQSSASYQFIETTSYTEGSHQYLNTVSRDYTSFFDGSYSHSYSDTTMTEYNGSIVPGSTHTYSAGSYTDPSGYTTYHSSQT